MTNKTKPFIVFEGALGAGRDASFTHADLVLLTRWMADENYDADDIAYAVEKPWKYIDELASAEARAAR